MPRPPRRGLLAAIALVAALGALAPRIEAQSARGGVPVLLSLTAEIGGRPAPETAQAIRGLLAAALERDYHGALSLTEQSGGALSATVSIQGSGSFSAKSTLTGTGGGGRSVTSHFPEINLAVPVIAGDLLSLWAGERPQETLTLGPAPTHVVSLRVATLASLAGILAEEAEAGATDLAFGPEGLLLALPRGPLTLDPLFRIIPESAPDLVGRRNRQEPVATVRLQAPLTGTRIRLLAGETTVTVEDPSSGRTLTLTPDGGPFADLVAMPWGGFALWRQTAEPALEVLLGRRRSGDIATNGFELERSLATAAAADYDGNFWVYDAVEARIRVFDRLGREIHAIKPLVDRSLLRLPQGMAVCPDGSFLLAASGELWKLDRSGFPLWRLRTVDARGQRALPPWFRVVPHGSRLSFSLFDPEAQEIHLFMERPLPASRAGADTEAALALVLRGATPAEAVGFCIDNDLTLIAAQLLGSAQSGEPRELTLLRRRLDRLLADDLERASATAGERLSRLLDLKGAEPYLVDAIDRLRELRAAYPGEPGYGAALEGLTARRQQNRDTLLGFLGASVTVAAPALHVLPSRSGYEPTLSALLSPAPSPGADSPRRTEGLVAELAASRAVKASTLGVGDLTGRRELRLPLVLEPDAALSEEDQEVILRLRLSGTVERSVSSSLSTASTILTSRLRFSELWFRPDDAAASRAPYLAWLAGGQDPCVAALASTLDATLGADPRGRSPLDAAAFSFGLLSAAFRVTAASGGEAYQSPRESAHALSGSAADALILAAALLDGTERAFLCTTRGSYLLIDTGIPRSSLAPRSPLSSLADGLSVLARGRHLPGETLLLPLAAPRAVSGFPLLRAAGRALEELEVTGLAGATVSWVSAAGAPVRSPYLPAYAIPPSDFLAALASDADSTRALLGR